MGDSSIGVVSITGSSVHELKLVGIKVEVVCDEVGLGEDDHSFDCQDALCKEDGVILAYYPSIFFESG